MMSLVELNQKSAWEKTASNEHGNFSGGSCEIIPGIETFISSHSD